LPWKVKDVSEIRFALCQSVRTTNVPVAEAAGRFGVSRKTAHKWLKIFDAAAEQDVATLADRSRRPAHSPLRTDVAMEARILDLRDHFNWGPRKIHSDLLRQKLSPPSIRTVAAILLRHQRIKPKAVAEAPLRFERGSPNELWQVDFKGAVVVDRQRIMPFTVLDDHSRYLLAFKPCVNVTMASAWSVLWDVFGEVGLPDQILCDNAFGITRTPRPASISWFDSRLLRLGIRPSHGRPYHPQTQGKVEALHASAERELFRFNARKDNLAHFEHDCTSWRHLYNTRRPHEALGDQPPLTRWRPSSRPRPKSLPQVVYPADAVLRRVCASGGITLRSYRILCGTGIAKENVRIEERDHEIAVFYGSKEIRTISHDQLKKGIIL
jgi:transposase InsO family protein